MPLFDTGVRPYIDYYLKKKSEEIRNYGEYWSASSGGYCMRRVIFERLGVPHVEKDSDARKQRLFEAGHVFHKWYQDITKNAGISIAQELELQDEDLMVRGHIDDLVLLDGKLILYDAKTQNSRAFTYQKGRPISYYHKMQLGTYMYMLRKKKDGLNWDDPIEGKRIVWGLTKDLTEARILKISKDDLRMDENQLLWDEQLEDDIVNYWEKLNSYWADKKIPPCTCADHEGGFLAKELYNPYFYEGEPCSIKLYKDWKEQNATTNITTGL